MKSLFHAVRGTIWLFRIERSRVNISEIRELRVVNVDGSEAPAEPSEEIPLPAEPVPDLVGIAEEKAAEIINTAHREADALRLRAEELVHKAEVDSEQLMTEARQLGYELGVSEGRADGEEEYNTLIAGHTQAFNSVVESIKRAGDSMIADMEGDIIDLCFSVLSKIAAVDRVSEGDIFKSIIKKAVSQVDLTGRISVRLSHEDFVRFFPDGQAVFDINDTDITATVTSDSEFEPGDIAVDTDSETVIATAETQLHSIELSFRHRIGRDNG